MVATHLLIYAIAGICYPKKSIA